MSSSLTSASVPPASSSAELSAKSSINGECVTTNGYKSQNLSPSPDESSIFAFLSTSDATLQQQKQASTTSMLPLEQQTYQPTAFSFVSATSPKDNEFLGVNISTTPVVSLPFQTHTAIDINQLAPFQRKRKTRRANQLAFTANLHQAPPPPPPPSSSSDSASHTGVHAASSNVTIETPAPTSTLDPNIRQYSNDSLSSCARTSPKLNVHEIETAILKISSLSQRSPTGDSKIDATVSIESPVFSANSASHKSVYSSSPLLHSEPSLPSKEITLSTTTNAANTLDLPQIATTLLHSKGPDNVFKDSNIINEQDKLSSSMASVQLSSSIAPLPSLQTYNSPDDSMTGKALTAWDATTKLTEELELLCKRVTNCSDEEAQSIEDYGSLSKKTEKLQKQLLELQEQQDTYIAEENFTEAEAVDDDIHTIKSELSILQKELRSPFMLFLTKQRNQLETMSDVKQIVQQTVESLQNIRQQTLDEAHDCMNATTEQFSGDLDRIKFETERLNLETTQIDNQHSTVANEIALVEEKIAEQTKRDQELLEKTFVEKKVIDAEVEELRQKLSQKLQQQQEINDCIAACNIRIGAIRSKYHKQISRLEKTMASLDLAKTDVATDRRQLQSLKKTILGNRSDVQERLKRFMYETGGTSICIVILQNTLLKPIHSLLTFRQAWLKQLEFTSQEDSTDITQRLNNLHRQLETYEQSSANAGEEILKLRLGRQTIKQHCEDAKTQKAAAISGRMFREAARLTATIKELQATEIELDDKIQLCTEEIANISNNINELKQKQQGLEQEEAQLNVNRAKNVRRLLHRYHHTHQRKIQCLQSTLSQLNYMFENVEGLLGDKYSYNTSTEPRLTSLIDLILNVFKDDATVSSSNIEENQKQCDNDAECQTKANKKFYLLLNHPVITRIRNIISRFYAMLVEFLEEELKHHCSYRRLLNGLVIKAQTEDYALAGPQASIITSDVCHSESMKNKHHDEDEDDSSSEHLHNDENSSNNNITTQYNNNTEVDHYTDNNSTNSLASSPSISSATKEKNFNAEDYENNNSIDINTPDSSTKAVSIKIDDFHAEEHLKVFESFILNMEDLLNDTTEDDPLFDFQKNYYLKNDAIEEHFEKSEESNGGSSQCLLSITKSTLQTNTVDESNKIDAFHDQCSCGNNSGSIYLENSNQDVCPNDTTSITLQTLPQNITLTEHTHVDNDHSSKMISATTVNDDSSALQTMIEILELELENAVAAEDYDLAAHLDEKVENLKARLQNAL